MECAHLSDAELLRLVRAGGEPASAALRELERRHFQAVRVFASSCVVSSSAADALAGQAWKRSLHPLDRGASGAVRPRALSVVLRTAVAWSVTDQRSVLSPDLLSWIQTNVHAETGGPQTPAGAAEADYHPSSVAVRAFEGLAENSQAVLWHTAVERDEDERVEEILGSGTEAVPLLRRRARNELYNVYEQLHQAGLDDECRPFHRMVLAYAEENAIDMAADLAPHLERCAACTRAVADLGRLRVDCGGLLAEAVLPWGGAEYGAIRAEENAPVGTALELLPGGAHLPHTPGRMRRRLFGRWGIPGPVGRSRPRVSRLVQSLALIGLASLAAAFAFSGDLRPGAPQSSEAKPSQSAAPAPSAEPAPSRTTATATATSTVTAGPSKPPSGGGKPRPPASSPPVRGAALEWVFDKVDGGAVTDTSGNGRTGRLTGAPAPSIAGSAARFSGGQAVVSDGPVVDTESSFTVSARVNLADTEDRQVVVSQDADQSSGFLLQYDADEDRWEMRVPFDDEEDAEEADADEAAADFGPETGEWTHLTGVYDDDADEIRLYVDGRLEDVTGHDSDFAADGDFAAGRGLSFGEAFRGVDGTVDDVRAFDRALSGAQVAALARRG
ncbi:concanavalin A-like lectin/glucanase superfamily protein [Streptomyces sp. Amel2xB2]|uniref:LamG domain-containing protein n=1 Tax=Streptomyces sp. Amel2xB2 TaxID=1305829 RepID=UPI000DB9DD2D|nr:LamG domain-containing protein [Streptomyces sp. Amel2xB2]RAJ71340.1 concanavalin A-like lectin/glucanase superfamily protein [Streptomyces sp. Amel2xB2]